MTFLFDDHGKAGSDFSEESMLRKTLARLDIQRKSMEHEADAIYLELTTPPSEDVEPMGIDTPLIDPEGYPRGDIDLYRARSLRQRFQVLKTDHKLMEGEIDNMLTQLAAYQNPQKNKKLKEHDKEEAKARIAQKPKPKFDPVTGKWVVQNWDGSVAGIPGGDQRSFENLATSTKEEEASALQASHCATTRASQVVAVVDQAPSSSFTTTATATPSCRPFARVDAIAVGSPADTAGLKEEDLIVQFGNLKISKEEEGNARHHHLLKAIAELVPQMAAEQHSIPIQISRRRRKQHSSANTNDKEEWESHAIQLTPRPWNGRGLIGCHIMPTDDDFTS